MSSAIYRYFASRDELLTVLIIDAYDALGDEVEQAAARPRRARAKWLAACRAIRAWALAHPHEYALVYGSPVPGYRAPDDTVVPGTRVSLALVGIVRAAAAAGELAGPKRKASSSSVPRGLSADLSALRGAIDLDVDDATLVRMLAAWTQVFGIVSFELFSQTRGLVEHHDELFMATVESMADHLGLAPFRS